MNRFKVSNGITELLKQPKKGYVWGQNRLNDIREFKLRSGIAFDETEKLYNEISKRRVIPDVKPQFLKSFTNVNLPKHGKNIEECIKECSQTILPFMTLWNHPGFLNWYPSMNSFPAIFGQLIANSFENPGGNWKYNKSGSELEFYVAKLFGKLLNLPPNFTTEESGGSINCGAGEASVNAAIIARAFKRKSNPNEDSKFIFYYSSQAHYSVKKGINIAGFKGSEIPTKWDPQSQNYTMNTDKLVKQIEQDVKLGLIPAYICSTLGTTSTSALDDARIIGDLSEKYGMWHHIDAAYCGNCFILEEYKDLVQSIKKANSLVINLNKWMPVSENSALFMTSSYRDVQNAFNSNSGEKPIKFDREFWEVGLTRYNRSIRLFTVIETFGTNGLKDIIRRTLKAAKVFERILTESGKFEIVNLVKFALVCFRIKNGSKDDNEKFFMHINEKSKLSIGPYDIPDVEGPQSYILRISINYVYITEQQAEQDALYLVAEHENFNKSDK